MKSPITAPVRMQFRAPTDDRGSWLVCVYTLLHLKATAPNHLSLYAPGNARPATSSEAEGCPRTDEREKQFHLETDGKVSNGLSMYKMPLSQTSSDELSLSTSALIWNPKMAYNDGYERRAIIVSYDSAMPTMFKALGQESLESYFADTTAQAPSQGGVALDDIGIELVIMPNVKRGDRVVRSFGGRGGEGNVSGAWNSGKLHPRVDASAVIENPEKRQLAQTQLQISIAISGLLLAVSLTMLARSIISPASQEPNKASRNTLIRKLTAAALIAAILFTGTRLNAGAPFTNLFSLIIGIDQ